ncbi:hypothetical protein Tco_0788385 [Tanacetum coccineum]
MSSKGYHYKVELVTPDEGLWYLTGPKWTEFCNRSLNDDVALLHFLEEGDDCFYVTEYNRDGNEFGGYGGNRSTFSRFMTCVLLYAHLPQTLPAEFLPNLNELDEIEISVNEMMLRCNVRHQEVISQPVCVFTKNMGKRVWLDAFKNDGSMQTEVISKGTTTLRREQLQLTHFEETDDRMKHVCFWPFYMDHFKEMPMTIYKRYALIEPQNRLTIPTNFVDFHHMHTYKTALIIHQEYQEVMEVCMVPQLEDLSRTNHVKIHGQWRYLAQVCHFPYRKMIRFRYMSDGEDLDVEEGENKLFPILHIC